MKVLVTGGSGFVGKYVIEEFHRHEYAVFGTYFEPHTIPPLLKPDAWFHLDSRDENSWTHVLEAVHPDVIIHLAGLANVAASWDHPDDYLRVNCEGTLLLLERVRRLKLTCRILIVGSAEVYGLVKPEENPIHENFPVQPRSPYGSSKACQEIYALQYARTFQMDIILARPFNHIGPGQRQGYVAADFASQIAAIEAGLQEPVIRVGNLSAVRDFTDVRDIARAYRYLIEKGQSQIVYNVCSGRGIAIQDLLDKMLALSKSDIRVEVDPEKYRPIDLPVLIGDPGRIQRTTGWKPRIPIEDTLRDILAFWRNTGSVKP